MQLCSQYVHWTLTFSCPFLHNICIKRPAPNVQSTSNIQSSNISVNILYLGIRYICLNRVRFNEKCSRETNHVIVHNVSAKSNPEVEMLYADGKFSSYFAGRWRRRPCVKYMHSFGSFPENISCKVNAKKPTFMENRTYYYIYFTIRPSNIIT